MDVARSVPSKSGTSSWAGWCCFELSFPSLLWYECGGISYELNSEPFLRDLDPIKSSSESYQKML